jgi:putative FmdB family regulatory protein
MKKRQKMPIYEYGCYDCRKRVSVFFRTFSDASEKQPVCPRCGGTNLKRLVSRVAVLQSEERRLENLVNPSQFGGVDENDPKSIGRWMRKMTREMGEDLGGEFDEVVDRLEAGENPESIEKSMPEIGGDNDDWSGD